MSLIGNASTHLRLQDGIIAAQAGDAERAQMLLREVLAEQPDNHIAWLWVAMVAPTAQDAILALRRVLEIRADHRPALSALGKLLLGHGLSLIESQPSEGRAALLEATRLQPQDDRAWRGLAMVAADDDERAMCYRKALALTPDNPELKSQMQLALSRRAVALARAGQRAEAAGLFREASCLVPDDARIWMALAHVAPDPAEAADALRHVLRLAPDHPAARDGLKAALVAEARRAQQEGDAGRELACWREAASLDSQDCEVWLALTEREEGEAAVTCAEHVLALQPGHPEATARLRTVLMDLGVAAIRRGEAEGARPLLMKAVELGACDERVWLALAQTTDIPDERIECFRRVLAVNPEHARAAAALKGLLITDGRDASASDPDRARAKFREVLQIDPNAEDAWIGLANVAENPASSLQALDQALRINPDNQIAKERIARLREETRASMPRRPDPPYRLEPPATPAPASRATILIVDDSPTVRKVLGAMLEREGFRVIAADSGEQALSALGVERPSMIFLDIMIPKLDGYEVCRRIRQNPGTAKVPVVMLSGKDGFVDKVRGQVAGATEYITKPFERAAVLAAVKRHSA